MNMNGSWVRGYCSAYFRDLVEKGWSDQRPPEKQKSLRRDMPPSLCVTVGPVISRESETWASFVQSRHLQMQINIFSFCFFVFWVFFATLRGTLDLSSPTRDQTPASVLEVLSQPLDHQRSSSIFQMKMKVKVTQSCPTLCEPKGLFSLLNSPGQNTGVGSLALLQGIVLSQGSNPGLPHCRWIL